jgi:ABC-type protease/lipase transport system fused ATPase/permease subunit
VIEALERLMQGRTVITIAHRLSTLRNADKIIVIKDGVVAEDGTHEELLDLNGIYARMQRLQFNQPVASWNRWGRGAAGSGEVHGHIIAHNADTEPGR